MNYTPTAIASVRFPYQAVRNIQCYLKLEAPPGHKIEITFSTVYFGRDVCTESGDGIILHDGETAAAPVIGRFCDRTGSALKVKQSTANSLFVTYKTGSVPMAFKAVYQFGKKHLRNTQIIQPYYQIIMFIRIEFNLKNITGNS